MGKEMVLFEPTPTTERFKRISSTFVEKANTDTTTRSGALRELKNFDQRPQPKKSKKSSTAQEQHALPLTLCPKPRQQQRTCQQTPSSQYKANSFEEPPSPDSHLVAYNDHLATFRTAIRSHISNVTLKITQTRDIQIAHEDEKRRRFATTHIRHSSAVADTKSPTKSPRGRVRDSKPLPTKDARLRSFWSLQIKDMDTKASTASADEEKVRERKERIERLKKEGWRGVRKEAMGWKGAEYYEGLRRRAEKELEACRC